MPVDSTVITENQLHVVSRQWLPCWMDVADVWQDVLVRRLQGKRQSWRQIAIDHMRHFNGFSDHHLIEPSRAAIRFRASVQDSPVQNPEDIECHRIYAEELLTRCLPRERLAIRLRYWHESSLLDVGRYMGVSESRAWQLVKAGLVAMRIAAQLEPAAQML